MAEQKELGIGGALLTVLIILGIVALIAHQFGLLPTFP